MWCPDSFSSAERNFVKEKVKFLKRSAGVRPRGNGLQYAEYRIPNCPNLPVPNVGPNIAILHYRQLSPETIFVTFFEIQEIYPRPGCAYGQSLSENLMLPRSIFGRGLLPECHAGKFFNSGGLWWLSVASPDTPFTFDIQILVKKR